MRYVSAYSKSDTFRRIFNLVPQVVFVVLLALVLLPIAFPQLHHNPEKQKEGWVPILLTFISWLVMAGIMRFAYRRLASTQVEVTDEGIHRISPGPEKTLMWKDLISARVIAYGKGQRALRVKTADSRFLFEPHLIPDTPDAPSLRWGFPQQYWLYPDGHKEPFDVPHSYGWKLVERYRPDLLNKH